MLTVSVCVFNDAGLPDFEFHGRTRARLNSKKNLFYSALISPKKAFRLMEQLTEHEESLLKEIEEAFPDQDGKLRISIKHQNEILIPSPMCLRVRRR